MLYLNNAYHSASNYIIMHGYYLIRISFFIIAIAQEMLNLNIGIGTVLIINPSSSTAFPLNTLVTGNVRKVHLP